MSSHHAIYLALSIMGSILCVFLGFCWGKGKSGLTGTPLGVWCGGGLSAFIGGFIEGMPIGSSTGAGLAAFTGKIHADLTLRHLAVEALFLLAAPCGAGLADIRNFIKANVFPNVFLAAPPLPIVSGKPETAAEAISHENPKPDPVSDPPGAPAS